MKSKVLEAYTRDIGRGAIRVDYKTMDKLKCATGDVVHIIGNRSTVAKILPLYPSDENKKIARLDSVTRANAEIKIGDTIEIMKATDTSNLEYLLLEPKENYMKLLDSKYITDCLEGIPVVKGDGIVVPYFGSKAIYIVNETKPTNVGIITMRTECEIENSEESENDTDISQKRSIRTILEEISETLKRIESKIE